MIKFSEFLTEATDAVIEVDSRWLENNVDALNADLDALQLHSS